MVRRLDNDIRWRVVSQDRKGKSAEEICDNLDVGKTFVYDCLREYRRNRVPWKVDLKKKGPSKAYNDVDLLELERTYDEDCTVLQQEAVDELALTTGALTTWFTDTLTLSSNQVFDAANPWYAGCSLMSILPTKSAAIAISNTILPDSRARSAAIPTRGRTGNTAAAIPTTALADNPTVSARHDGTCTSRDPSQAVAVACASRG
jgi:transposase